MKNLLGLIEQHNATRRQREQLYTDIRNLEGQLYYTVYDEETGESHQEERPGIRDSTVSYTHLTLPTKRIV